MYFKLLYFLRDSDSSCAKLRNYLKRFGIPEYTIWTKTYHPIDRCSEDQILSETLKFKIAGLVKTKLFGALLQSKNIKHTPGECYVPENTCVYLVQRGNSGVRLQIQNLISACLLFVELDKVSRHIF